MTYLLRHGTVVHALDDLGVNERTYEVTTVGGENVGKDSIFPVLSLLFVPLLSVSLPYISSLGTHICSVSLSPLSPSVSRLSLSLSLVCLVSLSSASLVYVMPRAFVLNSLTARDNAIDADELAQQTSGETARGDVVRAKAPFKAHKKGFHLLCVCAVNAGNDVLERILSS